MMLRGWLGRWCIEEIVDNWGILGGRVIFHKNARIAKILNESGEMTDW